MLAPAIYSMRSMPEQSALWQFTRLFLSVRVESGHVRLGDMAVLACLYDCGGLLLMENTPAVLDTARTDILHEVLATVTNYI